MLYQNSSCTRTGVPRKNQMYSQLARETSGFGERRMIASTTPNRIPMTIAMTVSSRVTTRPSRIGVANRYSPTTLHSKCGSVMTDRRIAAAITRTIAAATQRPGRRTGTATISSGRPAGLVASVEDTGCFP